MIKKIFIGYVSVCLAIFRFILLMTVCVGTGILVVYPLWKLADSNPSLYSLFFTLIFSILFVAFAGNRMRMAFLKNSRHFLISVSRKITLLAGISISVILVLNYARLEALIVLLLTLSLYGFLAFGLSADKNTEKTHTEGLRRTQ